MNWRELLDFIEPLLPYLGFAAILVGIAVAALAITGSMAAVEIAKYYRRKNRLLEDAVRRDSLAVTERELRNTLQGAVTDAMAPLREEIVEVRAELGRGRPARTLEMAQEG